MSRSDGQKHGTGKWHGLVGVPLQSNLVPFTREWCYVCARRGLDPYHRWAEHEKLERREGSIP